MTWPQDGLAPQQWAQSSSPFETAVSGLELVSAPHTARDFVGLALTG